MSKQRSAAVPQPNRSDFDFVQSNGQGINVMRRANSYWLLANGLFCTPRAVPYRNISIDEVTASARDARDTLGELLKVLTESRASEKQAAKIGFVAGLLGQSLLDLGHRAVSRGRENSRKRRRAKADDFVAEYGTTILKRHRESGVSWKYLIEEQFRLANIPKDRRPGWRTVYNILRFAADENPK
jgi:hypothetical protein